MYEAVITFMQLFLCNHSLSELIPSVKNFCEVYQNSECFEAVFVYVV